MHPTETPPDPFALDPGKHPFLEATLIQCVAAPALLQWQPGGGGFFAETEAAPAESFTPATLRTQGGKRVAGLAARICLAFPVVFRTGWELGEPGSRIRIPGYREGARSHTQALDGSTTSAWAVVTARGLASQALVRALRQHRYWAARELQAKPFVAALSGVAGEGEQVGVTRFQFVTLSEERCPPALGQAVRGRWPEVCAWSKNGPASPPDEARYLDGTAPGGNRTEQGAFAAYMARYGQPPASRARLRAWWQAQKGGADSEST